jgi:hypothetical protein
MKFETENLELIDRHEAKGNQSPVTRTKKLTKLVAVLSVITIAYLLVSGGFKSKTSPLSEIPQFALTQESSLQRNIERTLFVSSQLSKMMGSSTISEFHNIPTTFARFLKYEQSSMSPTDKYFSNEILDMMRLYQSNKVLNGVTGDASTLFWAKIGKIFNLEASLFTTSTQKLSGKQLEFWQHAEKDLS